VGVAQVFHLVASQYEEEKSNMSVNPEELGREAALPLAAQPQQAANDANIEPSALLKESFLVGQNMVKDGLVELIRTWVHGTPVPLENQDEFTWFISKRANFLINAWLINSKFSALEPLSPTGTGHIVILRERVEHVLDSRTNKDSVAPNGVIELLGRLFAHGSPKYAPSITYSGQLLMFDPTYKANDPAAKGEAPVAVLQFEGAPYAHLRLQTAYWAKPAKTKALEERALAKGAK